MLDRINAILDEIQVMRNDAFKAQDQELHTFLGRAFSSLIRVKERLGK